MLTSGLSFLTVNRDVNRTFLKGCCCQDSMGLII